MKRDMDFIRDLLPKTEADQQLDGYHYVVFNTSDFPSPSEAQIAYHIDLLIEAGFLKSEGGTMDEPSWDGHEFLADTRDPGIWESVKEGTKGLPEVAISAIWELAKAEVKRKLGLP